MSKRALPSMSTPDTEWLNYLFQFLNGLSQGSLRLNLNHPLKCFNSAFPLMTHLPTALSATLESGFQYGEAQYLVEIVTYFVTSCNFINSFLLSITLLFGVREAYAGIAK